MADTRCANPAYQLEVDEMVLEYLVYNTLKAHIDEWNPDYRNATKPNGHRVEKASKLLSTLDSEWKGRCSRQLLTADCSYHPPVQSQSPPSELLFEHRLPSQAPRVSLTLHPPAWRLLHSVRSKLLDCSKRRKDEHQASSPLLESVRRQPATQTRRRRSPGHQIRARCRQLGSGRRRTRRFLQRALQKSSPGGPPTTLHGPISSNCAADRKGGQ
jgi:hypothetical protein